MSKKVSIDVNPLFDAPEDERLRCLAHDQGAPLLGQWMKSRKAEINSILAMFDEQGRCLNPISATAFSDLYKWTMMPVIRKLDPEGKVRVTFGVDLRDEAMRAAIKAKPLLRQRIHEALQGLELRPFSPDVFSSILQEGRATILSAADIAMFSKGFLVDKGGVKPYGVNYVQTADDVSAGRITISFYENPDAEYKAGEKGVFFIEATGPWHRITWLETSMMQCVYEAKLRFDLEEKGISYKKWLYGALLRCAKSVIYTRLVQGSSAILPALFTGRRTGGLLFLLLQNFFFADHFNQSGPLYNGGKKGSFGSTNAIGTSSCDSWFILKSLGLPCLNPVGTHAHELSMVISVLFPQLDQNPQHLPLTQVIGHYLYYELVAKKTGGAMTMLPDTLGSRAFLKAATYLQVEGEPFLKKIKNARQDSGDLKDFLDNMTDFGFTGTKMASEIDDTSTLLEAAKLGYDSFGAGGFFGDAEKVWGSKKASSNSMAVKAVRVQYKSKDSVHTIPYMKAMEDGTVIGYPVKIGDPSSRKKPELAEGKLSLDKNLDSATIEAIKRYAGLVRVSASQGAVDELKSIEEIFSIETGSIKTGGRRKSLGIKKTVGRKTMGRKTVGRKTVGRKTVGRKTMDRRL